MRIFLSMFLLGSVFYYRHSLFLIYSAVKKTFKVRKELFELGVDLRRMSATNSSIVYHLIKRRLFNYPEELPASLAMDCLFAITIESKNPAFEAFIFPSDLVLSRAMIITANWAKENKMSLQKAEVCIADLKIFLSKADMVRRSELRLQDQTSMLVIGDCFVEAQRILKSA